MLQERKLQVRVVEQRRSKRFELKLPITILKTGPGPVTGIGETENLSSGGVLFASDIRVPVGDPLEYLIALPTNSGNPANVNLRCLGKILRIEGAPPDGVDLRRPFRMVATIERYEFVRQSS